MTHKVYGTIVALIGVVFFMSCSNVDTPDVIDPDPSMIAHDGRLREREREMRVHIDPFGPVRREQ